MLPDGIEFAFSDRNDVLINIKASYNASGANAWLGKAKWVSRYMSIHNSTKFQVSICVIV